MFLTNHNAKKCHRYPIKCVQLLQAKVTNMSIHFNNGESDGSLPRKLCPWLCFKVWNLIEIKQVIDTLKRISSFFHKCSKTFTPRLLLCAISKKKIFAIYIFVLWSSTKGTSSHKLDCHLTTILNLCIKMAHASSPVIPMCYMAHKKYPWSQQKVIH